MKKGIKKFLTLTIAFIFIITIGNNTFASQKNQDDYYIHMEQEIMNNNFENTVLIDENENGLLLGKYAVMTERTPQPKTKIELNPKSKPTGSFEQLPAQFSWTNYAGDWTSPVKDQGGCGSCWAFSALAAMEAAINLASGFPNTDVDLSEQYVLSCLPYGGSCNGGWTDDAFEAIINIGSIGNFINGVPLESCMPYQAVDWIPCDDKCQNWDYFTDPPQPDNVLWQLESWGADHSLENDNPNDLDIVKTYLMEKGPMSASMYASSGFSSYWNSHHDPDDWYYEEDHGYTNHAVLLVGWKDDPEVTNGGFFRLKNSWGTDFGYGGYFNVAYGGLDIGEIVRWCKTPDWPEAIKGPGPGKPALHVFANFDYEPEYPKLGDEIEFYDSSIGNVALWEWDFDGDGVIDSNLKKPKYRFYEEGEYEVSLTVWSSAGLNNTITRIVEVKEIWPPIAIASPEYYSSDDSVVYFDARYSYDVDGEIVSYHWDFDDGKTSDSAYLTHEFSTIDKIYNVTLTVTDDEGATSRTNCDIRIDKNMPPETEATFAVGADKDKWFRGPQEVTLVVNDWTGVYRLYYRVNDDDFNVISCLGEKKFTHSFRVTEMGIHTIEFYSVDVFENQETLKTENIKIDMEPPTLSIDMSGGQQVNGWYVNPVTVNLDGSDDLSGLDKIVYKLGYGAWTDYTEPFSLTDGQNRLWAISVDKAGNSYGDDDDPIMIKIDSGPPNTQVFIDGIGSGNKYYKTITISLVSDDPGIGVDSIYYNVDGAGGFKLYSSPFEINELGDHTIDFYAVDKLGNEETSQSVDLTISPFNFDMEIVKPTDGLYLFGYRFLNIGDTVVIGSIDIDVSIKSFAGGSPDVEYIEFFLDGVSKIMDSSPPYIWRLDEQLFGTHEVKVTAYNDGDSISVTKEIRAFIL